MKKIVLTAVFVLISTGIFAQTQTNSISVNGSHTYSIAPEYHASMIVSLNNVYYEPQLTSLSEIKATYLTKLEKAGIDRNSIIDDDLSYAILGYDKEGTIFRYKTSSLEEMKKFLSVKSIGVTKSETNIKATLGHEEMATYAEAAYKDAKKKAEQIAKKIGKSVGKVTSFGDSNSRKIKESLYYGSLITEREYYISVSFELL